MQPTRLAAEFVAFCLNRRSARWPEIYDEMCWVAGRRLFRGLGYEDLSREGLVLDLHHAPDLQRLVEEVAVETG